MDTIPGKRGWILTAVLLLAISLAVAETDEDTVEAQPVHTDAAALHQAYLAAATAWVSLDVAAAKDAVERIGKNCRELQAEEREFVGPDVLAYDRAFHTTLSMIRGMINREKSERAFEQFYFLQKACRTCHLLARNQGLMGDRFLISGASGEDD